MQYMMPMLAKSAEVAELVTFCEDDDFGGQQKVDGDRMLVYTHDGRPEFWSRNGFQATGVSYALKQAMQVAGDLVFDGEYLSGIFFVFDLLYGGGIDFRDLPLVERIGHLQSVLDAWDPPECIRMLPLATTHVDKVNLAKYVLSIGAEGLVFKRLDSAYKGDRKKRSLAWRKIKFYNEIDCIVTDKERDGKDNWVLSLMKDGNRIEVGEVSAQTGDGKFIELGDVVVVKYLYASDAPSSKRLVSLVQPTVPRIRHDKEPADCTFDQLIFTDRTVKV